jgi:hypothetical protein
MRKLEGFYNPIATTYVENFKQGRELEKDNTAMIILDYDKIDPKKYRDMFEVPNNFNDAWYNKCHWQRKRWQEAITNETTKMKQQIVWKFVKKSTMKKGRNCIKCKWVFDIKRDGTFRARLVA